MLILAFDTATDVATSALVRGPEVLGERASRPVEILADFDALLGGAGLTSQAVEGIVVGRGPGSYTGLRMGLITARALAFSLDVPVAGVSTLDALAAGSPGATPVIDAKRREVFVLVEGAPACRPVADFAVEPGVAYVGNGAVRYRAELEEQGALVPPDDDPAHVPWARHHAAIAGDLGSGGDLEPFYLRAPDAEKALRR